MLTINLEANVKFLSLKELVKIYTCASDKASIPASESHRQMMYRLSSTFEIENEKKRHENINKMFCDDEASRLLNVTHHAGDKIVLLDDLIRWTEEKSINLNQERIRGRRTYLEMADDRIQEQYAKNSLRIIEPPDATLPTVPLDTEVLASALQTAPAHWPVTPALPSAEAPVSTPQAAQPSDPATLTLTGEAGLSKRERQIRVIESAIKKLGYSAMAIEKGGKKKVEDECKRSSDLFGGGVDPFKESWQAALDQNRVRTVKHNQYARRD